MTDSKGREAVRVGATIRALREAHGLKLGELAAALGKSHSFVSNIECGRKEAPIPLCREIADLLGVPLAAITVADYEVIRTRRRRARPAGRAGAAA
jgi:transcriptional regulator with XRE-family HTH domain